MTAEREKREWWAVSDGDVLRVTGYSCAPANPDMWWCPAVGYSMAEGHHLFDSEQGALDKAIEEATRAVEAITKKLGALKSRRGLKADPVPPGADVLATNERTDGRREWWTGGTWLRPGQSVVVMEEQ